MKPILHPDPVCPICRRPVSISAQLTLPTKWRRERLDESTIHYLTAMEGRLVAEVWQNEVSRADLGKDTPADWHWQFHALDRCCGTNPGGNAPTRTAAFSSALTAFRRHAAELGVLLAERDSLGPERRWRRVA